MLLPNGGRPPPFKAGDDLPIEPPTKALVNAGSSPGLVKPEEAS